jgi:hypothetical protein
MPVENDGKIVTLTTESVSQALSFKGWEIRSAPPWMRLVADGLGIQRTDLVRSNSPRPTTDAPLAFNCHILGITNLSLFGATVTSWKQGGKERLFLSSKSSLDSSKPVSSDGIAEVIPTIDRGWTWLTRSRFEVVSQSAT